MYAGENAALGYNNQGPHLSTKYPVSRGLSLVLPAGALGASLLLSLSSAQAASSSAPAEPNSNQFGVAARLQAIRAGVSQVTTAGAAGSAQIEPGEDADRLAATWWGNGGWGRWHAGWGNGGWRFGWHNGGWGNGWPNGWHNWGNGWNNWGNGWHNYWHNG